MPNNLLLLEEKGVTATPPDPNANAQRVFVPREAVRELTVLGVIGSPVRRPKRKPKEIPEDQMDLFRGETGVADRGLSHKFTQSPWNISSEGPAARRGVNLQVCPHLDSSRRCQCGRDSITWPGCRHPGAEQTGAEQTDESVCGKRGRSRQGCCPVGLPLAALARETRSLIFDLIRCLVAACATMTIHA